MTAPAPQCQPRLTATRQDDPTPQEFAAWADEAQACINSGEVFISDHRKANATVTALRSHATLKARVIALEQVISEEMYPENCADDANRMLLESAIESHDRRIKARAAMEAKP